ncbi:mRNA splicing protein, partial [Coniosporium uncinatum]
HAQNRGPRIVGANSLDQSLVLKRTGPPPYGSRTAPWRPRSEEDFGSGGAFPEVHVAQYPLGMGKKESASTSNALALKVDTKGKVDYTALAKRGHGADRHVQASFKDLIPLRNRAEAGELSLERPSEEEVQATKERTQNALAKLVSGALSAQNPKNVKGVEKRETTYVRYTPANQMGNTDKKNDRIIAIKGKQIDPMEPPKHKHKKIPRGPPSPPPPVLRSPPRKLTAEDQAAWKIPPSISNWKNPKGYTIALDKRLASDGRGMSDTTISDKFSSFAEALYTADRHAREEVRQRATMQQKVAEKEKMQKEEHLRALAQKARQERAGSSQQQQQRRRSSVSERPGRSRTRSESGSRTRSSAYSSRSRSQSAGSEDEAARDRQSARRARREENQRQLRQSRMGTERRMQMLARDQGRDISEKIALGLAKPTQNAESMYDARLFNRGGGLGAPAGFNEDNVAYDRPLFAAQDAISSIYRPKMSGEDDEEDGGETMDKIQKGGRFEVLGRAKEGFKGAGDAEEREGPVQFEKDTLGGMPVGSQGKKRQGDDDPFGIDGMIAEASGAAGGEGGKKRYGLDAREDGARSGKKARVEVEDDDD